MPDPIERGPHGDDPRVAALAGFSPAQIEFLAEFSASYVAGKKALCWAARAVVAVGMVAGGIAAIAAAITAIIGLRGHP